MSFPWSRIDLERDVVALLLGDAAHAHALGQVLPDEAVEVLIAASLP